MPLEKPDPWNFLNRYQVQDKIFMILADSQALFFDFDGVLADSLEVKTRAFARLFEPFGADIAAKVVDYHRRHGGVTRVDKFRYYYQHFLKRPLEENELADLCSRFESLVVDEVVAAPEIAGAEGFLRRWSGRLPCFVVSAAPQGEIREIVQRRGWAQYFREVCGAPTSKRDNLAALLKGHNFSPAQCWFFGDAESDYRAAQACGVPFWGILPGPQAPLLLAVPDLSWSRNFIKLETLLGQG